MERNQSNNVTSTVAICVPYRIDFDDPIKSSLEKLKTHRVEIDFAARQEAGGLYVQI